MDTVVIERDKTRISWSHRSIEVRVELSDLDQIVIKAPKYAGYEFANGKWIPKADEIRKMKLTHLTYSLVSDEQDVSFVKLTQVTGNFFNKGSNRIGIRNSWLQSPSKEVIEQIPDEYHRLVREHFDNTIKPALESVISKGIVIGEKENAELGI